ncbi:hypothetical protein GQ600_25162 [Phytophthora cactorum]|nr:hypothetical protein GQ600_25162 [Phytophthora cactorum]
MFEVQDLRVASPATCESLRYGLHGASSRWDDVSSTDLEGHNTGAIMPTYPELSEMFAAPH